MRDNKIKCFFSTDGSWGTFEYDSARFKLMPSEGEVTVNRIVTSSGVLEVPVLDRKVNVAKPLNLTLVVH